MSDSLKRGRDDDLPSFDDPADLVNAVISTLQIPEERTNVATEFANDKNMATEVQAYAKIAGRDWTFYVRTLAISIGRNTDMIPAPISTPNPQQANIDLGPAKVVSRQHAAIKYNMDSKCWELQVLGRNGARIDGNKVPVGAEHATPLHSGAILDIGGTQMMFILPDASPDILPKMLSICMARYKQAGQKLPKNHQSHGPMLQQGHNNHQSMGLFSGIASFQMFDKTNLAHSPSAVSAVSLQNNLDQDLSKEDAKDIKPPYSYATMITQAILSNPDGVMSLSEIYNWIASHYAYYKYSKTGWQNSIRHNLSLNKAFEKVPRRPNEPGKGMKWQISDSYKEDFMKKIQNGTLLKSRRGSSVSRTLQIHLATHHQLPDSHVLRPDSRLMSIDSRPPSNDLSFQKMIPQSHYQGIPPPPMSHPAYALQMNGYSLPQFTPSDPQGGPFTNSQPMHNAAQVHSQQHPQYMSLSGDQKTLASPLRHNPYTETPKLPKVSGSAGHLYNLPPPTAGSNISMNNANYGNGMFKNKVQDPNPTSVDGFHSLLANSSAHVNTSESLNQNSTAPTTSNTSELGMGYTSPKKVTALEAFTPERGSKGQQGSRLGVPTNGNTNQSSPAFWNFVQFSTPNGQSPSRKDREESNEEASPTFNKKTSGRGIDEGQHSPSKENHREAVVAKGD